MARIGSVMDDPARPEKVGADGAERDMRSKARTVHRLFVSRIVATAPSVGLAVALGVVTLVGLILGVTQGRWDVLRAMPHLLGVAAGFGVLALAVGPFLEGKLADIAQNTVAPGLCPALLETTGGLPLGRHRARIEHGLARSLDTITPQWWEAHAKEMRQPVQSALAGYEAPSRLRPMDGRWIESLVEAIARAERTEFVKEVEALERAAARRGLPGLAGVAQRCAGVLRARMKRDRDAATLLRPAEAPPEILLRPAEPAAPSDDGTLLRPVFTDDEEDSQTATAAAEGGPGMIEASRLR